MILAQEAERLRVEVRAKIASRLEEIVKREEENARKQAEEEEHQIDEEWMQKILASPTEPPPISAAAHAKDDEEEKKEDDEDGEGEEGEDEQEEPDDETVSNSTVDFPKRLNIKKKKTQGIKMLQNTLNTILDNNRQEKEKTNETPEPGEEQKQAAVAAAP